MGRNSTTECRKNIWRYKYLAVLERDITMCEEMIRNVKEVYQKRITLSIKTHLNVKILFLALNTWAISVTRYSAAWIERKRIQKNLIVGSENSWMLADLYILSQIWWNFWRGLINVEEWYAIELRTIDFYVENSEEELLKVVARSEKLEKD